MNLVICLLAAIVSACSYWGAIAGLISGQISRGRYSSSLYIWPDDRAMFVFAVSYYFVIGSICLIVAVMAGYGWYVGRRP